MQVHLAVSRTYNGKTVPRGCQSSLSELSFFLNLSQKCEGIFDVIESESEDGRNSFGLNNRSCHSLLLQAEERSRQKHGYDNVERIWLHIKHEQGTIGFSCHATDTTIGKPTMHLKETVLS